jgi:4,5-DOPA dioxygenase extradiol
MKDLMPVLFVGHGSPMNAVQENGFTRALRSLGRDLPRPKAILVVSAHWLTKGTFVSTSSEPEQIYDFYGFPETLYEIAYRPKGSPELAKRAISLGEPIPLGPQPFRGIDHGAWAVLKHLYPAADVPVVQLSISMSEKEDAQYRKAAWLKDLRSEEILIIGSGNIVHNLALMSADQVDPEPYVWASEFDRYIKEAIQAADHDNLTHYWRDLSGAASLAVPTNDHYLPLLYVEGVRQGTDRVCWVYEGIQHKSVSMRTYLLG